jgi:hypothetical protein
VESHRHAALNGTLTSPAVDELVAEAHHRAIVSLHNKALLTKSRGREEHGQENGSDHRELE